jgi:hypothetical protein
MTWGGTNWGNLGHPGGYTSYDYASPIREDRRVDREKYSEQKVQANFFKVSPAYLTATRGNASNTTWTTTSDLSVTPAFGNGTGFYFLRHSKYNSLDSTSYKLKISTSAFGNITVPQTNGTSLTLNGRDAKIHVSDYDLGGTTLVYSTAEIFTWHKYADKTVLVVYGGPGETHELALAVTGLEVLEGDVQSTATRGYTLLNFKADGTRKVAKLGVGSNFVYVHMLGKSCFARKICKSDLLTSRNRPLPSVQLLVHRYCSSLLCEPCDTSGWIPDEDCQGRWRYIGTYRRPQRHNTR